MSEAGQYSPEYHAQKMLDARVRDAQRVRVWTAAYAAVAGALVRNWGDQFQDDVANKAAAAADIAVLKFDESWRK